jgi:hypothetical protein
MARNQTLVTPTLGVPRWAGDFMGRESLLPGGARLDAAQFASPDAVRVTVGAAGALAGATTVPVDALSGAIPNGTVVHLGTNKFVVLNAAAVAGETSLTTLAIPVDLVDNDTGLYAGVQTRSIPSGTFIGRTIVERDAGTGFGPWADGDDEAYLIAFDISDALINPDVELYRNGRVVKENFLPGWSTLPTATQTAIRARYTCVLGAE